MTYTIDMDSARISFKTQKDIRAVFWMSVADTFPNAKTSKRQNDQPTDIRCAFVDFVDSLNRDGMISDALAHRVTL